MARGGVVARAAARARAAGAAPARARRAAARAAAQAPCECATEGGVADVGGVGVTAAGLRKLELLGADGNRKVLGDVLGSSDGPSPIVFLRHLG